MYSLADACQVQPGVQQIGSSFFSLLAYLKEFNRIVKLPFLERGKALFRGRCAQFVQPETPAARINNATRANARLLRGKPRSGFQLTLLHLS